MSYDVSIDSAKARHWLFEVRSATNDADAVLSNLLTAMQEVPGNDTIIETIYDTAKVCENGWKKLIKEFGKTSDSIEEAISAIVRKGEDVVQIFKDAAKEVAL